MLGAAVTYNGITINNNAGQPNLWADTPFYYIAITNVDGLYTADISYESHPIPNLIGEKSGDVFRRGKTVTLSGNVTGFNYSYLLNGVDRLYQMFAATALANLSWTRQNDGVGVYLRCRVNQDLSVVETVDSLLPRFSWVVGLRADDPRIRKTSDNSVYPTWQA